MASSRNRPPESLLARVRYELARHAIRGQRLCVGLSGGADSVALLLLLRELQGPFQYTLSALHVHHGLIPDADEWETHCRALCLRLGVRFSAHRVSVARDDPRGLESAARDVRHAVFTKADVDFIALAHHRGDQAETLLFRLLRGAGPHGCAAMRASVPERRLLRPLLGIPKIELEHYVRSRGETWCDDASNASTDFSRNFLRTSVLPQIESRFPGAEATLARAATLFAESADLLGELAEIDLGVVRREDALDLGELRKIGPARTANLLRYLIARHGCLPPDCGDLRETVRQMFEADAGRELARELSGLVVARGCGQVVLLRPQHVLRSPNLVWSGERQIEWDGGGLAFCPVFGAGIRFDIAQAGLDIRHRAGGERLALAANRPRRSIKQLCQAAKVPWWARDSLPMIWQGADLIAAPGLAINPAFACPPDEPGLVVSWQAPERRLPLS